MSESLAAKLRAAERRLASISDSPRLDAELLLAHSLGCARAQLLGRLRDCCDAPGFGELLQRRYEHEPIAYIVGEREFFSLTFNIERPLLVPRPETEHLVEACLEHVGDAYARVLELGSGSGCVAVSLAVHGRQTSVVAGDIALRAVAMTRRNAERHGVQDRVHCVAADGFSALAAGMGNFDAVVSNPPYVETGAWETLPASIRLYEDPAALLAGPGGLDVIRRIITEAWPYLRPGGLLALEIGMGQYRAVARLLSQHGYESVTFRRDLAGVERIALGHKPG